MNKERMETVKDIQKDFVYDRYELGDYIVYHCHRPGTISYSFEILIGKMGIYVGGDIGSLVYRVARGLEFLAGDDVDYYQHSKLDHDYYSQVELSKRLLDDYLRTTLIAAAGEVELPDENVLPEDMTDLDQIIVFYRAHNLDVDVYSLTTKPECTNHAWSLYEDLKDCTDIDEIYRIISESSFYMGDMPSLTQASESIMFRLYMVNHAAKKILKALK